MKSIRVIVVDDQHLETAGLSELIEKTIPECNVIARASNGNEAMLFIDLLKPDIVFMDILMPELNGLEALHRISKTKTITKVIITSGLAEVEKIAQALRAGAAGYFLKHSCYKELRVAVETVMSGKIYLSPEIDKNNLQYCLDEMAKTENDIFEILTSRQRETWQLISEGNTEKEMAAKLFLSEETVKSHRKELMARLGIHDIARLVQYAVINNIIAA
jgi:two-component system, NarL family, response regulator NreC